MFQNVVKFTYKTSLMTCSCLCAASFAAQASEMQCFNVNCESLGYTNVEDLGSTPCKSFLTCPYDPRYIKCDLLPTCENLGFTNDDKSAWCTNLVRCPTDPSYTLCQSLCGKCPEGTALDPAELGCTDGYEAAKNQDNTIITNDCDYTCYKCTTCDDEEYEAAEETCSEESYIVEVRYPKCPSNAGLGPRYVCESCRPLGLTNSGENNYDCTVLDDEGNPIAGCDGENFFNSLAECVSEKGECVEHPTAFGICYASSAKCGKGALSEYKYSFEGQPPSREGHEWFAKIDSTGQVCYKTTCLTKTDDGVRSAFATEALCQENHQNAPRSSVVCKDDGYSCYVFDRCADGYKESSVTQEDVSCVCDTDTYPYTDADQPSYGHLEGLCLDSTSHYREIVCDGGAFPSQKAACESLNGTWVAFAQQCNSPSASKVISIDGKGCFRASATCGNGYKNSPEESCPGGTIQKISIPGPRPLELITCSTNIMSYPILSEDGCYKADQDHIVCKSDNGYTATGDKKQPCKCDRDEHYYATERVCKLANPHATVCSKVNGVGCYAVSSCSTGYTLENKVCTCDESLYPYTQAPTNGLLDGDTCTDPDGTIHYANFKCNSGYHPNGFACVANSTGGGSAGRCCLKWSSTCSGCSGTDDMCMPCSNGSSKKCLTEGSGQVCNKNYLDQTDPYIYVYDGITPSL